MNDEVCVVAVDVGNSAAKLAVRQGETIVDYTVGIETAFWEQTAIQWAREQPGCGQRHWRIASVRGSAADQLAAAMEQLDSQATVQRVTRHDIPMKLDVDHPDRVGIDRILSAYAVSNRVQSPAVVVDAGSAVTVDWINPEGWFCGGAILPGLGLQARALATGTEALPHIAWNSETEIRLPARNTTHAIRSGILTAIAAGIDALIQRYCEIAGRHHDAIPIVITGGDGLAISPHLRHIHQVMPNLVCRGLFDLPRSTEGKSNTGPGQA